MRPLKHLLKQFLDDTRGSIILIGAVTISMVVGVGGAAYDFGIQQMALKNGQFAADLAATSASAAKLHERLDEEGGSAEQHDRVEMYYRLNSRGFNVDRNFTPEISITETSDAFVTRITGKSRIQTSFLGALGIPTLNYTVETETNLRNPGDPVNYDLVMILDYTTSMIDNEIEPGVTRLQALQQASRFLVNTVMCGDENGQECEENSNRASIIPYALSAIGLDECDLPDAPLRCICMPPRGVDPADFELPNECLPPCQRDGATDSNSPNFNCTCVPPNQRPQPSDVVERVFPFLDLLDPAQPKHGYAERCLGSCLDGGCCPQKCREPGSTVTINTGCMMHDRGTEACARCQIELYHRDFRIQENVPCCPDIFLDEGTEGGNDWGVHLGPLPEQTVGCHRGLCTASCTHDGVGQDPCVTHPEICSDPCQGPNPPPGCTPGGATPQPFDLGRSPRFEPKTYYAAGKQAFDRDALPMFSAIYNYAEHAKRFAAPKVIPAQSAGGVWAVSLRDCIDEGQLGCLDRLNVAIDNDYTEGNTNSASGFLALLEADSYLPFMRPNTDEDEEAVRVVVWVTDGENNRFQFSRNGETRIIPEAEIVDGVQQRVPEDLDQIVKNRYDGNGRFRDPTVFNDGFTAQEFSDAKTKQHCRALREFRQAGQEYPIIIYGVAVGEVGNLGTEEGRHTAALMNECVYGLPGQGLESETPPIDPATGQPMQKRFFAVQSVAELNRAFRTIAGTIDRIRITD